jgi:hypothetical protein
MPVDYEHSIFASSNCNYHFFFWRRRRAGIDSPPPRRRVDVVGEKNLYAKVASHASAAADDPAAQPFLFHAPAGGAAREMAPRKAPLHAGACPALRCALCTPLRVSSSRIVPDHAARRGQARMCSMLTCRTCLAALGGEA